MSRTPSTHRSRVLRHRALAVGAGLALVLAACGGGEENLVADGSAEGDPDVPTQSTPEIVTTTTLASVAGQPCVAATNVPEAEGKPGVIMPVGDAPTELVSRDIVVGDGAEAELGDTVKVHYVGIACSTGEQFDSSWDAGEPVEFQLVEGGLIQGWIDGLPGMKVGGQRQLEIPSDLAYGTEGRPGIAPDESLVFVIDLVEVVPAGTTTTTTAPAEPADETTTTAPAGDVTTTTAADE